MKFNSAECVLKWAFESSKPLSDSDSRDQAILIIDLCDRILPTLHMAYVRIKFGRESVGLDVLCHNLAANFGTGAHSRRTIGLIIRAYCGEKIGLRDIRKSMNCGILKAASIRNRAYDTMDIIHTQAMDRLRFEFDSRGLLSAQDVLA